MTKMVAVFEDGCWEWGWVSADVSSWLSSQASSFLHSLLLSHYSLRYDSLISSPFQILFGVSEGESADVFLVGDDVSSWL